MATNIIDEIIDGLRRRDTSADDRWILVDEQRRKRAVAFAFSAPALLLAAAALRAEAVVSTIEATGHFSSQIRALVPLCSPGIVLLTMACLAVPDFAKRVKSVKAVSAVDAAAAIAVAALIGFLDALAFSPANLAFSLAPASDPRVAFTPEIRLFLDGARWAEVASFVAAASCFAVLKVRPDPRP